MSNNTFIIIITIIIAAIIGSVAVTADQDGINARDREIRMLNVLKDNHFPEHPNSWRGSWFDDYEYKGHTYVMFDVHIITDKHNHVYHQMSMTHAGHCKAKHK